ncbi:2-oxoglutarate dehydrogenase E1 component [Propionivibrio soli]|uniref:2-oxoglutarate dehydrogenase E1 component n=1 Tax=Propionivibrio soli TaxID=2976531 RepID=UPI0021E76B09|nr:2-oxoglutarate dehydrogenase E1 component [Propionivibrio soli]
MMNQLFGTSPLFGGNAPFVEELYENYLDNPTSVPGEWREYFDKLAQLPGPIARDVPHLPVVNAFAEQARKGGYRAAASMPVDDKKQVCVLQLIRAHRTQGARWANLDPLKRQPRPDIPELEPAFYGLTSADFNTPFNAGSFRGVAERATLGQILDAVRETYCGSIGVQYMYINHTEERRWIEARFEPIRGKATYTAAQKQRFLERLTAAETLERYLHTRYVGQKRFSLEGGESLIVALDELVRVAGAGGVDDVVVGMAHRGRLNVLVNVLGKAPSMLFDEFEGKPTSDNIASGDVKYHLGYSSSVSTPGGPCQLTLAFNPSHLEIVNPVVEGAVYSRQHRRGEGSKAKVLPVLIHGDAAVAGQGVNQEMLNFGQTRGFGTGGTVHIVVNNQIGFTTSDPRDSRSTLYCTDLFKMVSAPIFHVNGDDPEAVAFVTRLAFEFRQEFKKDAVVDIVCFRKLGHNEQDEPMVTQPLMYKRIAKHPGTRQLYADKLVAEGALPKEGPEQMITSYREHLDRGELLYNPVLAGYTNPLMIDWTPFLPKQYIENCDTTVPVKEIKRLAERLTTVPESFSLHSRVQKIIDDRKQMGRGSLPFDWGMAENMAYASLLVSGYGVRITGQDVGRGTFFHRHAALHDQKRESWDEGTYYPLANLQEKQAGFQCFDSILSEEAVLAFEYGYATSNPFELVVWEAQFGDFVNGAQVVVDQFIASGETKWGRACGLVLLLPHGYEGQGPEHSSGRIERFMQLCAEMNMEVCQPSTPAQVFHMLRRQAIRKQRKPLVVFSPKSLLRHKDAVSTMDEMAKGSFRLLIGEVDPLEAKDVKRVIFCSGKVYYDLIAARREKDIKTIAIARLEQIYPFPQAAFEAELAKYPNATEVVWCQEEPRNQGAWYWFASRQHLARSLSDKQQLLLVSRPASPSPAVGYYSKHNEQKAALLESALGEIGPYKPA